MTRLASVCLASRPSACVGLESDVDRCGAVAACRSVPWDPPVDTAGSSDSSGMCFPQCGGDRARLQVALPVPPPRYCLRRRCGSPPTGQAASLSVYTSNLELVRCWRGSGRHQDGTDIAERYGSRRWRYALPVIVCRLPGRGGNRHPVAEPGTKDGG